MRHPHADIIHAWAEGKEVEYYSKVNKKWLSISNPNWNIQDEYRIKPKTIKFRNYLYKQPTGEFTVYVAFEGTNPENWGGFIKWIGNWQEVEID